MTWPITHGYRLSSKKQKRVLFFSRRQALTGVLLGLLASPVVAAVSISVLGVLR